jgi:cellulase
VTVCPDEATCAKNCIVEGINDYASYGITTSGSNLNLHQLVNGNAVSPRCYVLRENRAEYEMLKLTGNDLSFDVDSSKLPCGMNGALYLSEMSETGGRSKLNPGGATYGTGYCDAQCFIYPFVNGVVSDLNLLRNLVGSC